MDTALEIPTSVPTVIPRPVPPELRDEAEVEVLGERIAHLSALLTATEYQLLVLIREFDQRYGWRGGFRNCAHWLNWRTGLAMGAAREKVRVARALEELPQISTAMRNGEISYSKVRALTRIAAPETEEDLLGVARSGTAAHLESLVRAWRLADAIGRIAEAALAGGLDRGTRGDRYQVVLHVDATSGSEPARCECRSSIDPPGGHSVHLNHSGRSPTTLDGIGDVSAETSCRIACDSSLLLMTHDETGRTLDVGRRTRVISPALRRALDHRDGGCRFPGCGIKHTDAHHLIHWADGGETKLDNLVLLCRRHHRCVHEEGYAVDLDETGAVRFQDPWGTVLPQAPPLPDLAEVPVSPEAASALLAGLLDEHGITLDPKAGMPDWDGRPLDLAWALDVLMN